MVRTKGAVAISFHFFGTSFLFVNCHLTCEYIVSQQLRYFCWSTQSSTAQIYEVYSSHVIILVLILADDGRLKERITDYHKIISTLKTPKYSHKDQQSVQGNLGLHALTTFPILTVIQF